MIDKIVALHRALRDADIAHAFGGALALAWCTRDPRATSDIDLNIFVPLDRVEEVLAVLPEQVVWSETELRLLKRDGQARLLWDETPVDLFFTNDDFHVAVSGRTRTQPFAGFEMPFLACADLAVFKAFFDREKDWLDLASMADACTIDPGALAQAIAEHLGADDPRLVKVRRLPRWAEPA